MRRCDLCTVNTPTNTRKFGPRKIASFDAYVFVTPEYNHSASAALKNAIDYLHREWNNKVAGFMSYAGYAGGAGAIEHLRLIMAEVMVPTGRASTLPSPFTDFENFRTFKPNPQHEKQLLVAWGGALKALRLQEAEEAAMA